jgi:hypothetical protein
LRAKEVKPGRLTLDHVVDWEKELAEAELSPETFSPLLLPEYTRHER